jgi:hypothetical protein
MMDDFYTYPCPQHPSDSPPPDYSSPGASDWWSATPAASGHSGFTPFGAQMLGDTAYSFLQSFVAWFQAVRQS